MISKLLLQHIMVVADSNNYPQLFEYSCNNNYIYPMNLPIPLSLQICKDFVLFFKELNNKSLYDDYYNLLKSKHSNNIYVREFIRIIKHILKLQDMLTHIQDVCQIILSSEDLDEKTRNSFYECCDFLNKYTKMCQLSSNVFRDHSHISNNCNEESMFFLEVLSECFLDIYALEYLVTHKKYYCFLNYLEILHQNQLESINDVDNWEVMMICQDEPMLMSHVYLPHPEDFKCMIQT